MPAWMTTRIGSAELRASISSLGSQIARLSILLVGVLEGHSRLV